VTSLCAETLSVLLHARPQQPFFSNLISAELFDAQHARGRYKLLPYAGGGYVVFDSLAELGRGALERHAKLDDAHAALERIAAANP